MTRLHHQLQQIRPRRGTAVVLLILACLAAALGASTANAQSPEEETTSAELCPGLQPLTMIVNLRTLRDGGTLTKMTASTFGECVVTMTLSEPEHSAHQEVRGGSCIVTAKPRSDGKSVQVRTERSGRCDTVSVDTSISLPAPLSPATTAASSTAAASSVMGAADDYIGTAYGENIGEDVVGIDMFKNVVDVHVWRGSSGLIVGSAEFDRPTPGIWLRRAHRVYPGPSGFVSTYQASQWAAWISPTMVVTDNTTNVRVTSRARVTCRFSNTGYPGGTFYFLGYDDDCGWR